MQRRRCVLVMLDNKGQDLYKGYSNIASPSDPGLPSGLCCQAGACGHMHPAHMNTHLIFGKVKYDFGGTGLLERTNS